MTIIEKRMISLLKEMKECYGLVGVKGEFEAEGASNDELMRLRNITLSAGTDLVLKIGGCEAISDICMARSLGVDGIVAPMIESAFAAKKFLSAMKTIFIPRFYEMPEVLINIETITGVQNLSSILSINDIEMLSGIDVGRVDMAGSYGLSPEESNSSTIYNACDTICKRWNTLCPEKPCTIGGFLNKETIQFLTRLSESYPIQSESKKIIFSIDTVSSGNLRQALLKAIEFETLWYNNCIENYKILSEENWNYFTKLPFYSEKLQAL